MPPPPPLLLALGTAGGTEQDEVGWHSVGAWLGDGHEEPPVRSGSPCPRPQHSDERVQAHADHGRHEQLLQQHDCAPPRLDSHRACCLLNQVRRGPRVKNGGPVSVDCGPVQFRWLDWATPQVGSAEVVGSSHKANTRDPGRTQGRAQLIENDHSRKLRNDHQIDSFLLKPDWDSFSFRSDSQDIRGSAGTGELKKPRHIQELRLATGKD